MPTVKRLDDAPRPSKQREKRIRTGRTKLGRAVFAQRYFAPYEIIGEVTGEVIDDLNYYSRYCMDLGDSRCLEPSAPFRYMNHSCQPNCSFRWYDIRDDNAETPDRRMFVLANERLWPGDELTIDYRWPAHMAIPCRCGSIDCRGWIVASEDLAQVLTAQLKT
jgi:hypothetical protein